MAIGQHVLNKTAAHIHFMTYQPESMFCTFK